MKLVQNITFTVLLAASVATAFAQSSVKAPPAAAVPMANGEVLKIYPKDKTILLKHGPIASIGMGPMTMEYGVSNSKLIDLVKPGDKIKFVAEQVKDQYVVTQIQVVK